MAEFRLTSPAFDNDGDIPLIYTQDGEDISPPIEWEGVPEGTKELVLVCEDPDADEGVFTHWVVYGILPEETSGLPEGLEPQALVQGDVEICQGINEFDISGWTGPPPADERGPHRFFFRLHALDTELDVPPGIRRMELRAAAKGHIIATAELVGIA